MFTSPGDIQVKTSGDVSREHSDELVAEGVFIEAALSSVSAASSISLTFAHFVPLLLKQQ